MAINRKQFHLLEPDVFDVLSAAWVLASNDENNVITYEGLVKRLDLQDDFPIRALIRKRRDLFRLGIPKSQLETWKESMLAGKRIPVWIREMDPSDRIATINNLDRDDGFRSQFRAEAWAEKSDLKILEWGLGHIERLRKAHYEANDKSAKSWQMWLVFGTTLLSIAVSAWLAIGFPH
ncbi:hypothetical protein [Ramlibacter rhizophilus]|uniref:Uncharacterized protein n=1 Tax=Ramlibacter rhizophilus TaxID=1781167 RepID=A0A4Z0BYM4_9BURK|nr:hypothetical protein [Ramlibacter rhizophilus]TFZ03398.1 hypothetical protein EZ242_05815 [Ramlibacter rhizophilus]